MIGVTILPDYTLEQCHGQQLQDIVRYFESELVFTPSPIHEAFLNEHVGDAIEVVTKPYHGQPLELAQDEDARLVWVSTPTDIKSFIAGDEAEPDQGSRATYLISDLLSVSIDLVNLDARLEGLESYRTPLAEADAVNAYTHLTINANPGYRAEWDGLDVQGVMPGANEEQGTGQAGVAHFELQSDGIVSGRTRKLTDFGLRAVDGIGTARLKKLKQAGIETRADLASYAPREIASLPGIGRSTAQTMVESAQVIEQGEIRKASNASLPTGEPIFIDIETDGLNPTVIWLIGVFLPDQDDRYMAFLETDPGQPEVALEAFLSWLTEFGDGRPIVAYNGWQFDFPVIHEQIATHCPRFLEFWESTYRFDPYDWAVREQNAILPGVTNKLADVARGLGWEPSETGLTGADVARLYQRYAENPCPETELDWDRHKRYCEDDVRAVAYIYERIQAANSRMATTNGSGSSSTADTTSQGTLSDF